MNTYRALLLKPSRQLSLQLSLVAVAALSACSTLPADNASLELARSDYRAAQANPQAVQLAGGELRQAGEALGRADAAWTRKDSVAEVNQLAYVARQRVAIAQETALQKAAELAVTNAQMERDKVRLSARTAEADAAQRSSDASQRQADASARQADASQRQAMAAQRVATDAQTRSSQLEAQLKELNAKQTERGMVITIGDVLFDTNKSDLKLDGRRSLEKLVGFLKQYPQRRAMVEGFTDSVGSESSNQALSSRRAESVRMALLDMGVGRERVSMQGYGETHPVASNDSADGRQLNRRVEIVLSDDAGAIVPR